MPRRVGVGGWVYVRICDSTRICSTTLVQNRTVREYIQPWLLPSLRHSSLPPSSPRSVQSLLLTNNPPFRDRTHRGAGVPAPAPPSRSSAYSSCPTPWTHTYAIPTVRYPMLIFVALSPDDSKGGYFKYIELVETLCHMYKARRGGGEQQAC